MSYYNLKQALEILQQNLPDTVLPFDLPQLADLCNCGVLTPMVYYSRFLDTIVVCEYDHPQLINAYGFKGYLTDKQLGDLVYEYSNIKNDAINQPSKLLYNADIHEIMQVDYLTGTKSNGDKNLNVGDRVALFYYKQRYDDNYQKSTSDQKEKDALTVIPDMIRFSATDIKAYIASKQTTEQNTPEQQEIAELKKELADLKEQLKQKADNNINSLLTAIHDKSHEYHAPDLSHAIRLWNDLYIDGMIGSDSHSHKANLWVNKNTSYGDNPDNSSIKRLREVSTPLKDFGGQRQKEIEK